MKNPAKPFPDQGHAGGLCQKEVRGALQSLLLDSFGTANL
jgi:hypothetical protein